MLGTDKLHVDFTNDTVRRPNSGVCRSISSLTAAFQCNLLHVQTCPFRQFMGCDWLLITKQAALGCLQHKWQADIQILRAVHYTIGQVFRLLNYPHCVHICMESITGKKA